MTSQLEQLGQHSKIVADTGEVDTVKLYQPEDATTNPSLILAASQKDEYAPLVADAISYGKASGKEGQELIDLIMDKLYVNFGCEILKIVPGYVSTEVDARLRCGTLPPAPRRSAGPTRPPFPPASTSRAR